MYRIHLYLRAFSSFTSDYFIHFKEATDQAPLTVVRPALEEYLAIPDNQSAGTVQDQLARANDLSQLMDVVHITRPPSS